jgi:hypothetical protein
MWKEWERNTEEIEAVNKGMKTINRSKKEVEG